ncbi:MAG: hypothetical protein HY700_04320 [Gemmatimonadetes bacterium]|nr:hypothetical protein [Gemmatimonadota bacterium]
MRRQQFAVHPHLTAVEWAEDFVNYLDECLLTIYGCCERDLRTYLYDYVPSERPLRTQRRPHVVLSALRQFFEYLSRHEEVYYPWAAGILADQAALARRWSTYPHGALDDDRMIEWRRILHDDLSARVLLPDVAMAGGGEWLKPGIVPEIGDDEDEWALSILFTLHDELSRRWLFWREEVLAAGVTEPARARAVLLRRQREWETRPHPGLGGEAPAEAVRKARKGK